MNNQNAERLLRRPEVRAMTGLSDSPLDRLVRAGQFPHPVTLVPGGRAVGWPESEVQAWIDARIAERSEVAA